MASKQSKQPMPRLTFSSRQSSSVSSTSSDEPASKLTRADCERHRRNKINGLIEELAKLVPLVATSSRKMDKMSVLRLTVAFLRLHHDVSKQTDDDYKFSWSPSLPDADNLSSMLLESVGGFLFVVSSKGLLLFVTDTITTILGHNLVDVLGCPLSTIIHPDDVDVLSNELRLLKPDKTEGENEKIQRSFYIRMLNVVNEPDRSYETIHVVGYHKSRPPNQNMPSFSLSGENDNKSVFVGVARRIATENIREMPSGQGCETNQWLTRHELDGQITYSDPRGASITGFLPGESVGFSPYALVHPDDISAVVFMHNSFFTTGHLPCTVFRMFTKSRETLYIKTTTHMVVDMWTSKPRFIISINEVLSSGLGRRLLARQRRQIEAASKQQDAQPISQLESHPIDTVDSRDSELSNDSQVIDEEQQQADDIPIIEEAMSPIKVELEMINEQEVNVVVGPTKFTIDLSRKEKYRVDKSVGGGVKTIFDITTPKSNEQKTVPIVEPEFIGSVPSPGPRRMSDVSRNSMSDYSRGPTSVASGGPTSVGSGLHDDGLSYVDSPFDSTSCIQTNGIKNNGSPSLDDVDTLSPSLTDCDFDVFSVNSTDNLGENLIRDTLSSGLKHLQCSDVMSMHGSPAGGFVSSTQLSNISCTSSAYQPINPTAYPQVNQQDAAHMQRNATEWQQGIPLLVENTDEDFKQYFEEKSVTNSTAPLAYTNSPSSFAHSQLSVLITDKSTLHSDLIMNGMDNRSAMFNAFRRDDAQRLATQQLSCNLPLDHNMQLSSTSVEEYVRQSGLPNQPIANLNQMYRQLASDSVSGHLVSDSTQQCKQVTSELKPCHVDPSIELLNKCKQLSPNKMLSYVKQLADDLPHSSAFSPRHEPGSVASFSPGQGQMFSPEHRQLTSHFSPQNKFATQFDSTPNHYNLASYLSSPEHRQPTSNLSVRNEELVPDYTLEHLNSDLTFNHEGVISKSLQQSYHQKLVYHAAADQQLGRHVVMNNGQLSHNNHFSEPLLDDKNLTNQTFVSDHLVSPSKHQWMQDRLLSPTASTHAIMNSFDKPVDQLAFQTSDSRDFFYPFDKTLSLNETSNTLQNVLHSSLSQQPINTSMRVVSNTSDMTSANSFMSNVNNNRPNGDFLYNNVWASSDTAFANHL